MSSKILLLPVEVSSSLLLILLSMYQWRAAVSWDALERTWLLQPFFVLGKTRTKQGHPKLLHIFSLHTPKEKVLWWSSWRSSSCHRGGWIQAAWGHWKAKHWRWWAGHLCRLRWLDILSLIPIAEANGFLLLPPAGTGFLQRGTLSPFWFIWGLVCLQKPACPSCTSCAESSLVLLPTQKLLLLLTGALTKTHCCISWR